MFNRPPTDYSDMTAFEGWVIIAIFIGGLIYYFNH
jgi:hypothetical protein